MEGAPVPASEVAATFKLLLIGDSGVGKSSILTRFTDDRFEPDHAATIGVDFKVKVIAIDGKNVKLTIWDTAGQERFRTLTSSYYRGAQGVIFVYDVCRRDTFESLDAWFNELETYSTSGDVVKMVVGNKIDELRRLLQRARRSASQERSRQVSRQDGEAYARRLQALFIECSAKTKAGVEQAFEELVQKMIDTPSLWQKLPRKSGGVELSSSSEPSAEASGCYC